MGYSTIDEASNVGGLFLMVIYPGSTNYNGQTVRESLSTSDGCWFEDSEYPELYTGDSSSWDVSAANFYGNDEIGIKNGPASAIVTYYQGLAAHSPGCGFGGSQIMSMDGLGPYATNGVGLWIELNEVTSYRGDAQITVR